MSEIQLVKRQGTNKKYFISPMFQPTVFFRGIFEEDSKSKRYRNKILLRSVFLHHPNPTYPAIFKENCTSIILIFISPIFPLIE